MRSRDPRITNFSILDPGLISLIISFENKLHYNAVCNSFKTMAEHKSQQQSKLYNMHMYNMLKCIKCYENINLKLATCEQW